MKYRVEVEIGDYARCSVEVSADSREDAKAEAEEAVRSASVEAVKVWGDGDAECGCCEQPGPYLCQGCGDAVGAAHSVATPEGGRICPDCEDTAAAETVKAETR